jgi:hypothetical protein
VFLNEIFDFLVNFSFERNCFVRCHEASVRDTSIMGNNFCGGHNG